MGNPVRIPITNTELARVRFAISPVYEALQAVDVLQVPGKHAVHLPWVRWARPLVARVPGIELLAGFVGRDVRPGVLVPVPDVHMPTLEDELDAIRCADPERVRKYFDNNEPPSDRFQREFYDDPAAGLARLADVLRRVFDVLVAPHWPRILGVLEADIAYRARVLADFGVAAVFDDLHPEVRWSGGELRLSGAGLSAQLWPLAAKQVVLDGRALVLAPGVFCWPDKCVNTKPTTSGILHYPARAVGTVWETRRPAPDALSALLGRTRAELLVQLAEPGTTTQLAGRLGVTAGAVSQHLGVLRGAGLVATRRSGRAVLHLRTERAEALLR
ncbi:MAG: winged helix-turn-helix transcriptional regulator [Catenulispora sp.]|nr:winged helix-turn-helix transcriptional regulator [Catenulispora sp.]